MLTSVENICEDQFWCVISEGWKTNEELIETYTKCPPVDGSTFKHRPQTISGIFTANTRRD